MLQVIQHIAEFVDRWKQQHPVPFEPPLVLKNEWGKEKIVCSTLRPTSLPQTELHDLGGIVQARPQLCALVQSLLICGATDCLSRSAAHCNRAGLRWLHCV